jgi:group I intron endonuclease
LNNKIYIGQDSKNRSSYLGSGKLIISAVTKYGRENFIKEVLEECLIGDLDSREAYWIAFYDSTDVSIGYNLSAGGSKITFRGCKHTEEYKRNMSKLFSGPGNPNWNKPMSEERKLVFTRCGKKNTAEHNAKLSASKLGERNPNYGKPVWNSGKRMTEEQTINMRKPRTNTKNMSIAKREFLKIKVLCPECGNQYNRAAAKRWHFDKCKKRKQST